MEPRITTRKMIREMAMKATKKAGTYVKIKGINPYRTEKTYEAAKKEVKAQLLK